MLTLGADTPDIFQIPEVTGLPRPGRHQRRARVTPQGARQRAEQGSRGHPPTAVRGPTRIPLHSPPPRPASRDRSPCSQAWPDGGTDKGTRTSGSRNLCLEGSPHVGGAQTRQAGHVPPPASTAHIALPLTTESTSSGSLCRAGRRTLTKVCSAVVFGKVWGHVFTSRVRALPRVWQTRAKPRQRPGQPAGSETFARP